MRDFEEHDFEDKILMKNWIPLKTALAILLFGAAVLVQKTIPAISYYAYDPRSALAKVLIFRPRIPAAELDVESVSRRPPPISCGRSGLRRLPHEACWIRSTAWIIFTKRLRKTWTKAR